MISLDLFAVILLGVWGCCVGSFLNVVIYRVPEGLSVVSPPSRCPTCEKKLKWFDNVPVLGWLWLRGKCRFCKAPISGQYPLVELTTGVLFAGLTWVYYFTGLRPVFAETGVLWSWPVLAVHLCLLACMIAATVIDAKLYIIPLGITWTASVVALFQPAAVLIGLVGESAGNIGRWWGSLIPVTDMAGTYLAMGAGFGLLVSLLLLKTGAIPLSFAEEPELPEGVDPDDPNLILVHPHPRREVMKEALFLLPVVVFGGLAWWFMGQPFGKVVGLGALPEDPLVLRSFGGVLLGYLVGGGVVWFIRIFGTLLFGKEAMGLGDVHLMAAVGAVIGWRDATLAFFVAPFIGILVVLVTTGVSAVLKGKTRVIPYGPSLCAATLIVMVFRNEIWAYLMPGLG